MTSRKRIVAAAAALLVVLAGYTAYWFIVAGRLDAGIDAWAAAQRGAGLTLDFTRDPVGGFPFVFRSTFHAPRAAGSLGGQAFDWRGADVTARVSPLDLHAILLSAPGRHRVALENDAFALDAGRITAVLRFAADGSLSQGKVRFESLNLLRADYTGFGVRSGSAEVALPPSPPKTDQDPLLSFALSLEDLKLPAGVALLTADPLKAVAFKGVARGPMTAAPLRTALAAWRDRGGSVDLSDIHLQQATLDLAGSATLALDPALQPIVAADLKARGLGATIDLLAEQKRIRPEDALKMKLFVKGAERDAPGGGKEVATGLTVQGGYLSWGPFKLAPVAPIEWP